MKKKILVIFTFILIVCTLNSCNSTADSDSAAASSAASSVAATSSAEETTKKATVPTESITTKEKTATKATETDSEFTAVKPTAAPVNSKTITVVLDAGHDSTTHTRNHPNLGVNEQDLNLKIAKYAYKRLKQYNGVKVYLSRPDGTCPIDRYKAYYADKYPEPCIRARTDFAEKKKADIFVSFHCNASSGNLGASANGTEVYVSKHPDYYSSSKKLGKMILRNITSKVDVVSRGVLTRSKPEKGTYPNGTTKDFYYLISNNIDNHRPALIVEHAYMDNSHDNAILKKKVNLKKFGIADADAIAQYYGLTLK